MAEARLIPKKIYHSRRYLNLPITAQHLLTFLILDTDNDGIVEAYAAMKLINAKDDDLRILEERGFIYVLNEDWVTYIREYQSFNHFDSRNYRVSRHRPLLVKIHPELEGELIKPQKRIRNNGIPRDSKETPDEGKKIEEKRIEQKKTKSNTMTMQLTQKYDFEQIEKDILSN